MLLGASLDSYYQALEIKLNIHNFKYERAGKQHFTTGKQVLIPKAHNKDERHTHVPTRSCLTLFLELRKTNWQVGHLEDFITSCYLLCNHARGSNHGQAAIVNLLGLHLREFLGIRRLEAKWIKAEVSRHTVGTNRPPFFD